MTGLHQEIVYKPLSCHSFSSMPPYPVDVPSPCQPITHDLDTRHLTASLLSCFPLLTPAKSKPLIQA